MQVKFLSPVRIVVHMMLAVILLLSASGCGKKADPIPPRVVLPPPVVDLKTESVSGGIALVWSVTGSGGDAGSFKILRSVTVDAGQACPACPQDYRPFLTVKLTDNRLQPMGEKTFRYLDMEVRDGGYYSYRIAVCNRTGQCSADSNESGTIRKER